MRFLIFLITVVLCSCDSTIDKTRKPAPLFSNIGSYHHEIKTQSSLAQRYFDQGLIFLYSFEFGESIRSFRAATKIDPTCAMCYWGLALALGSKTDMPIDGNELSEAKLAIQTAEKNLDKQNLSEKLYIGALKKRYETTASENNEPFAGLCSSYTQVRGNNVINYANAMKQVVAMLPNDADAKTLYAAALFDQTHWDFWHQHHQQNPKTLYIIQLLESILKSHPDHPGANHLYVHIIEASPYPQRSLAMAKKLNELVPISEHLAHMPAHTYYSLGLYHEAVIANQNAIDIYQKYVAESKAQGFEPEIQYLYYHNIDYLAAAASMEGNKKLTLSAANNLQKEILPLVQNNSFLQKNLTPAILMLARFGQWQEILKLAEPSEDFQYVNGIWHYAKGLAETQTGQLSAAKEDLEELDNITQQGPIDANLSKPGYTLLQIAKNILGGVIAGKENNPKKMISDLQKAVSLQDSIDSFDPPPWYFPVRELLGTALLEIKNPKLAKQVFLEDLKKHPHNPWSLYGLAKAEHLLGNLRAANATQKEFHNAWKYADMSQPIYPTMYVNP